MAEIGKGVTAGKLAINVQKRLTRAQEKTEREKCLVTFPESCDPGAVVMVMSCVSAVAAKQSMMGKNHVCGVDAVESQ
ncbi:hypothetical protein WMY93_031599 [Mugilogobius chulae]|uniref:Uncharacterized protein n=1 Tax=Mugilogobius chulae TaxID=88201 RepID=A0AAW0ME91_9GOBI